MEKSILLISDSPEDASFLSEVSQVVQAKLHVASDAREGVDFLADHDCVAIFVDISKKAQLQLFESEAQKRFGLFSDRLQTNSIHFISDQNLSQNRDAVLSPLFGNFFQRAEKNIEQNGQFYGRFVKAGELMATHGLKNFLSERGQTQTVVLQNTDQKQEAAEAVRQYLIAANLPGRVSNIIANAVDELLMNALFDAPCDEFGRPIYSATSRCEARHLKDNEQVSMTVGFDGFYVGVSVTDGFGSIDRNRLLSHVSANYRDRDYQIRQGQAGAGLGISTIFHSGGTLIYHCESQHKTEATLLYRAYPNYRDFKNQFKFFSAKFFL